MTKNKIDYMAAYQSKKAADVDFADPMNNLITTPIKEENTFEIQPVERRTKRVQIVLTPQLYEQAKKEAHKRGVSFNELVNQLLTKIVQ